MQSPPRGAPLEEVYVRDGSALIKKLRIEGRAVQSVVEANDDGMQAPELAWWSAYVRGARVERPAPSGAAVRIVDLFCGAGGLGLGLVDGLRACGFRPEIELAVDVDAEALAVYSHNLRPRKAWHGSVSSLVDFQVFGQGGSAEFAYEPDVLDEVLAELSGQIDVICAGPPCQGHSNLNNHSRREDPRNLLYLAVPAIAVAVGAPIVIIENVPEITNDRHGVVESTKSIFSAAGYTLTEHVLNASLLGCPQTRRRYFLIASKDASIAPLGEVARVLQKPPVTLAWAIEDLMDEPQTSVFAQPSLLSAENQRRIDFLFDEDEYDLPDEIRPDCHKDGDHTYGAVYGRLRWEKPSGTITTGFMTPGRGRFTHPERRRGLTAHEGARLQGFPDSFEFMLPDADPPTRKSLGKWIGDAVPPVMGYAAGVCVATVLGKVRTTSPMPQIMSNAARRRR